MAQSDKFLDLEKLEYVKRKMDTEYQKKLIVGSNLDNTPTQGSTNPITSGAVYAVIGDINSVLESVL